MTARKNNGGKQILDAPTGRKDIFGGLTKQELTSVMRTMLLSRAMDEKILRLLKQGKMFFHIGCAGHEAIQIAVAKALRPGTDWAFPYYRGLAFSLAIGIKPEEIFLHQFGKADDPFTGGRQMPGHYSSLSLNVPTQSSPTGSQYLQSVGCALASVRTGKKEVTVVSSGEGATSQGEFHEAVNWASREKLPVIFLIENNRWAISVPVENQTAGEGGSIAEMTKGYKNLFRQQIDGTNYLECNSAAVAAVKYSRNMQGPSLIEADVVRLFPHSSSDDQKKYRPAEQIEADKKRDPINLFKDLLIEKGTLTDLAFDEILKEVNDRVDEAANWAENAPDPEPESASLHVFSDAINSKDIEYENYGEEEKPIVMVDAINHAMREEMEKDASIYIFGEDIADGKGGVFSATKGLSTRFGDERVFNSPLAEASIVGVAIGMAQRGLKPVVEIQFADYIWPAMQQIRDELALIRYRSNNAWSAHVVIRTACGGFIHGGHYHSQNIESFFAHCPGLYIAYPSNAADAKGLLKTAIQLDDPVLFLEHKGLYRQSYAMSNEPGKDYYVPFGKGKIKQHGEDLTIVTWGSMVNEAIHSAKNFSDSSIEIIDIRTIVPLDKELILESVKKTGKVLIVHEDTLSAGFGAEIAAIISDEAFEYLDGPVKRIGAKDTPIPYHPNLEYYVLPTKPTISKAIKEILEF
ncbi:MAG: tungsten formylmethanofuran dehydrogenase [Ignavibacteria bacterium]|nr:tungsten formylmethanofuran dehydrogenase [Ignavibacteria bacterium]